VKLQRFAAEARVLNVARMKELTAEKRFALAASLLFRQLARAYDDAADMLIRQVQRIHYKAKELMDIRQASHLQQAAELGCTLRNITIAYQQGGSAEQRLHAIGALLENWNSTNEFICYGRQGELATNSREQQEATTLSLQLLQNCLMLINTILIQRTIDRQGLWARLQPEDFRALTPLFYGHINPYGLFELDLEGPSFLEAA
jgi:TnpA family transposase